MSYSPDYAKQYYRANKARMNANTKAWRQSHPKAAVEHTRRSHLKAEFGLTTGQYDAMLQVQGGVCAICKTPPGKRRLAVDHDHSTGMVRALLCVNCNTGIGKAKDSIELLEAWVAYLKRWGK